MKKTIIILSGILSFSSFAYDTKNIKDINSGTYKTFFVLENGYLYTTTNKNNDENNNIELISSDVKSTSVGNQHALKIDNNNNFFVVGDNDFGQLGLKYDKEITNWTSHTKIKKALKVLAKNKISFIINEKNELYASGINVHSLISNSTDQFINEFVKIADNVSDVAGSSMYITYLNNNGELFAKGIDIFGFKNDRNFVKIDDNVSKIEGGEYHVLYLKNNQLFGFGSNIQGQLGNIDFKNLKNFLDYKTYKPILISDDVVNFSVGDYHSSYLNSKNELYVSGNNGNGQLGLGHEKAVYEFTLSLSDVKKVYSGPFQIFAIKNDDTLWITGNNSVGQLTFISDLKNSYFYGDEMRTNINKWTWKPIYFKTFDESYED